MHNRNSQSNARRSGPASTAYSVLPGLIAICLVALGALAACNNSPGGSEEVNLTDTGPTWTPDTSTKQDTGPPPEFTCPANNKNCGGTCVNTTYDPDNCGDCGITCDSNESCQDGNCVDQPDNCNEAQCQGFAYCNLNNGQCQQGCARDGQCGQNETCDSASNTCGCESGTTEFRGLCLSTSECNETFCADDEYCDFESGDCQSGCYFDDQCETREICNRQNNSCECAGARTRFKGTCVTQDECNDEFCGQNEYCDLTSGTCRDGCSSDAQCGNGEICNLQNNACECTANRTRFKGECVTRNECESQFCSSDEYCNFESGNCEPGCTNDSQCGNNESCNLDTNACVCDSGTQRFNGSCVTASQCASQFCSNNEYCDFDAGTCQTGCQTVAQCSSDEVCDTDINRCVCDSSHYTLGDACLDQTSAIDTTGNVGGHADIAAINGSNIQIAYYDATNDNLKHARWDGSSWSTSVVDSLGDRGFQASIALDNQGDAHIAYINYTGSSVFYAEQTASGWSVSTVTSGPSDHAYPQLALDGSTPHIAYYDVEAPPGYKHAVQSGASWTIRDMAYSLQGRPLALETNSVGEPRAAIIQTDPAQDSATYDFNAEFLTFNGSTWTSETVESFVDGNHDAVQTALHLQPNGRTVGLLPDDTCDLTWFGSEYTSGSWNFWDSSYIGFCVDSELSMGSAYFLYSGNYGDLEIAYYDSSTSQWYEDTLDNSGEVGYYVDSTTFVPPGSTTARLVGAYYNNVSEDLRLVIY